MTRCVMGIDLGTSQVKAGLYGIDGTMLALAAVSVPLRQPAVGRAEQDLDGFLNAAAHASRQCMADADTPVDSVESLAIAGQMAGVGLVDRHHRPLAPYDSWLDTRCSEVAAELDKNLGERITATTGCAPTISIGPKMAWWQRHQARTCADAASFVTAAGHVAASAAGLSGAEAFIDPTYLHFTSVADGAVDEWDAELVSAVGLDDRLLPRIVASTDIVGHLTAKAADQFGLPSGLPIAAGCGDTAASALGAGVLNPGEAFDIAGTAAVFGICRQSYVPDPTTTLMIMRAALPGRWYALAYVAGAGQLIDWTCRELLGEAVSADAYHKLSAAAAAASAGSDGVLVSPHLSGRVAPAAPTMRGTMIGLSPITTRGDLARATLESIAYEYRRYAELARTPDQDQPPTYVIGMGGGARSAAWNQIKADVLQMPYRPVTGVDAGTRGAAAVAASAIGDRLPPLPASAYGATAEPDADNQDAYDDGYRRYRHWTDRLAAAYADGQPR
jgi:xylulokinase